MKDGAAHPNGPDWVYAGEHGAEAPLWGVVPTVKSYTHDDNQRAAVELERIVDRYQGKLPSPGSLEASEIARAAQLLYTELFRDCGQEARRQKLRGMYLLEQFLVRMITVAQKEEAKKRKRTIPTEDIKRARAYMVADILDHGASTPNQAAQMAVQVAKARGLDLGSKKSFSDAYDEYQSSPNWLQSGIGECPLYWPVTKADLPAVERKPSPEQTEAMHHHLAAAAEAMPANWRDISHCVRQATSKALYMKRHWDESNENLAASLCEQKQPWQRHLFAAVSTGAPMPGERALRALFTKARKQVKP